MAAALIVTALLAGAAGAVIASGREEHAPTATQPTAAPAIEAKVSMCETLEAEYPQIVGAINERNKFDNAPWTDPGLVAAADHLAEVTRTSADRLEQSIDGNVPPGDAKAGSDYVTALRAMSISESAKAPAKQLNGIASLYNSVVDPVLAICGIKG